MLANGLIFCAQKFLLSGPEVIKRFSCSIQLSTKFQLLIKTKIPTNEEISRLSLSDVVSIMLINVKMPTINYCWHFNIYEHALLS